MRLYKIVFGHNVVGEILNVVKYSSAYVQFEMIFTDLKPYCKARRRIEVSFEFGCRDRGGKFKALRPIRDLARNLKTCLISTGCCSEDI
jgi:hypothetical protein